MSGLVTKTCRVSLALLLSLWITGAGCMFGCGEMVTGTAVEQSSAKSEADDLATIVSGDACATHGSHDCCAKKKAAAKQSESTTPRAKLSLQSAALLSQDKSIHSQPTSGVSECPLAISRAVVITKARSGKELVAPLVLPAKTFTIRTAQAFQPEVPPAARLPNESHTYLRCCVFLI